MTRTLRRLSHYLPDLALLPVLGFLCLVAIAATQAACGGDADASPEQAALGKLHFDRVCATCHGRDAHGLPKQGKDLHANEFTHSLTDQELVDFSEGGPALDPSAQHPRRRHATQGRRPDDDRGRPAPGRRLFAHALIRRFQARSAGSNELSPHESTPGRGRPTKDGRTPIPTEGPS